MKYKQIKIIGDSLSAGAGSSMSYKTEEVIFEDEKIAYHQFVAPNGWGSLLEKHFKKIDEAYSVKNRGCCGAYSYQIDRFLDRLVSEEDQLVLILMGANDRKRICGMEELRKNCDSVILKLREMGKNIVLMTPNPSTYSNEHRDTRIYHTDEVVAILREAAAKNDVCLIDNYKYISEYLSENQIAIEEIMQEEGCLSDGLHPTNKVQKLIFENVVKELGRNELCQKI